jgi:ornithine cyclodeaminase/alanine dehydrogenase-like protein (mu-crystallin family)
MSFEENSLLYLRRCDVQEIAKAMDPVAVLREVFRSHASGHAQVPEEAYLRWSDGNEQIRSLAMPGYVGGAFQAAGVKIINSNPANPERGIPRADGLTVIHESRSGRIVCVMEGAFLSGLRTAAVTMLAAELLAPADLSTVAILGAGFLAQSHIDLIPRYLRGVKRILVYDIRPERASVLQERNMACLAAANVTISVVASAEPAIREADLVIPVTTTTTGYIPYEWLKPGCLVVNVSLDDVEAEVALRADLLVVDDWNLVKHDQHRLLGRMFRAGQITGPNGSVSEPSPKRAIDAELGEIILGVKQGRRSPVDIVLMNPFGIAIEDVALGAKIYERAKTQGMGIQLPR